METTLAMRTTPEQPYILLPAFIDDQGPFSFVLDTGAGVSITTEEVARYLTLRSVESKDAVGAGGRPLAVLLGEVGSLSVGEARVHHARLGIMKTLPRCVGQGVIGHDFLKHFKVTIDYGQDSLTLASPGESGNGYETHEGSVPLRIARPDRPLILVDAIVNSRKTFQFVLDTGASLTVVSPLLAAKVGLSFEGADSLVGAGGQVASSISILTSLRLGENELKDVSVTIADIFSHLNSATGASAEGILGYNVLRNFTLILDFPGTRMCFEKLRPDQTAAGDGS